MGVLPSAGCAENRVADSPVFHLGQSGSSGLSGFFHRTVRFFSRFWTERFVQPDCPVLYGGLSGLAVTASSDNALCAAVDRWGSRRTVRL